MQNVLTPYVPVVDPVADPATESAIEVLIAEGWPEQAVTVWASVVMDFTRHALSVGVGERRN